MLSYKDKEQSREVKPALLPPVKKEGRAYIARRERSEPASRSSRSAETIRASGEVFATFPTFYFVVCILIGAVAIYLLAAAYSIAGTEARAWIELSKDPRPLIGVLLGRS